MKFSKQIGGDGRPLYKFPNDRSYLIPGDIHFPLHSESLVAEFTMQSADVLFLQGDTGDQEAFSKFVKDPEKIAKDNSMNRERDCWRKWLFKWLDKYDTVIIGPGNHETRAWRSTMHSPGFVGLGWWWPYGSLFEHPRIVILDMDYRARIGNVHVEHGDRIKESEGKFPALNVAEHYSDGNQIVFGHSHKRQVAGFTSYTGGQKKITTAYNVGTLVDIKQAKYVNQPNWQPGAAIVDNNEVTLL